MEKTYTNLNWTVVTNRNSPSISVTTNGVTRDCRVLSQIIVAPDGSKVLLEQHLSNEDHHHDVLITKVQ